MLKHRCTLILVLILALLLFSCACAESDEWTCPLCNLEGNTGNFCSRCASVRPGADVNDGITQIPGETDRVRVDVLRIDGSDFVRASKNKWLYAPEKTLDLDDSTCWQVAVKKNRKKDPWLAMIVEGQTIDEIWIKNGFRATGKKGKDQYPLFARLKEIRVVFCYDDEVTEPDEMTFTLSDENTGGWEKLDTGRHENVYDVWIYILSVYPGKTKAATACLDEVMLVQKAPSENAKPVIE